MALTMMLRRDFQKSFEQDIWDAKHLGFELVN